MTVPDPCHVREDRPGRPAGQSGHFAADPRTLLHFVREICTEHSPCADGRRPRAPRVTPRRNPPFVPVRWGGRERHEHGKAGRMRQGWDVIGRGVRRRGRLLAAALRPPLPRTDAPLEQPPPQVPAPAPYVAPHAGRLVPSPVFVLSPVRSGSTLLRVLLNSHSRIRAPHEMHLRTLHVHLDREFTADAMRELELDRRELEHLLWDRVLHRELTRSGKEIVVDKTPPNTLMWPRLRSGWPQARYLFLLRHPAAVVGSLVDRRADPDLDEIHAEVLDYCEHLEDARQALDGHTLTYEHLTAEPEQAMGEVCRHLGVEWEPEMLDYGRRDHGPFRPHIGDWSSTLRSGRIQAARGGDRGIVLPAELTRIAERWGYDPGPAADAGPGPGPGSGSGSASGRGSSTSRSAPA